MEVATVDLAVGDDQINVSNGTSFEPTLNNNKGLLSRIINLLATYYCGNSITVDFEKTSLNETFLEKYNEYDFYTKLWQAVSSALQNDTGCMFYYSDGDDEITSELNRESLVSINLITSGYEILKAKADDRYLANYNSFNIRDIDKKVMIHPSRYSLVSFDRGTSFAEKITPICDAVDFLAVKIDNANLWGSVPAVIGERAGNADLNANLTALRDSLKVGAPSVATFEKGVTFDMSTGIADFSKNFEVIKTIASAITGIPKVILWGDSPSSVNSGKSRDEIYKAFLRDVKSVQNKLKQVVISFVGASMGYAASDFKVTFEPPETLTELEKATVNKVNMEARKVFIDTIGEENMRGLTTDPEYKQAKEAYDIQNKKL